MPLRDVMCLGLMLWLISPVWAQDGPQPPPCAELSQLQQAQEARESRTTPEIPDDTLSQDKALAEKNWYVTREVQRDYLAWAVHTCAERKTSE